MVYDYNLLVALPSGRQKAQEVIRRDTRQIHLGLKRHQTFKELPAADSDAIDDDMIAALLGDGADDSDECEAAYQLVSGGKAKCISIEPGTAHPKGSWVRKFMKLNAAARSRLVVFGHGNRGSTLVGHRTPGELALLLYRCGLNRVTRVSLIACFAGGEHKPQAQPAQCFASRLHWLLRHPYGVVTEITARTGIVSTDKEGHHLVQTVDKGPFVHKAPDTKYLWKWDGDRQVCEKSY